MIKNLFCCLFIICTVLQLCSSIKPVTHDPPNTHPSHPGKCYSLEKDQAYRIGDKYTDRESCQLVKCEANLGFRRTGCENRRPQEGCERLHVDSSKDYPDCCPKIKCGTVKIDY